METIVADERLEDPRSAGNKAAMLARLTKAGFDVPPFFVISGRAAKAGRFDAAARETVELALAEITSPGETVAVRSSSIDEDGLRHSFAGQFESYLDVRAGEICNYAARVAASVESDRLRSYHETAGGKLTVRPPSVLVQRMVHADVAGVAFAADPVSGDRSVAMIAATHGTGDALVGGEVQGDTWRVDQDGLVIDGDIRGDTSTLASDDIAKVAALVRAVSKHVGCPQDIEWAIAGGRLYLLQSRNITSLDAETGVFALWDNSNIVESYGGVTLPLTFSIAREAYEEAYRQMGRALGIRETVIDQNASAYRQMIGLIRGRVYYNLLNWYRLLMLTPGFRYNRGFMEQMMGVTEGLPEHAVPCSPGSRRPGRWHSAIDTIRVGRRLLARLVRHDRDVSDFHRRLDDLLAPVDLATMSLDGLVDHYEWLQSEVIPAWETPLVNDLYCMIFHGALRKLSAAWLPPAMAGIHNELVAGDTSIVSMEPVRQMRAMAAVASRDAELCRALQGADATELERRISANPAFASAVDRYLERFGDRCLDELKLESPTLRDQPEPLFRAVGGLVKSVKAAAADEDANSDIAERRVAAAIAGGPLRRWIYFAVLRLARARIRDRENLRFERTRVYGRVRGIFAEIGRRLADMKAIDEPADVFLFDVAEIAGYVRGTGINTRLDTIARARRDEFTSYETEAGLPRRFVTCGPPQQASSMQAPKAKADAAGDERKGQGCSRGVVRGRVRIVRDPRQDEFEEGEILVAERTDPGWVTIFPLVSAMIMERGSLLSHSAIVARELGIPTVVGVDDACRWLSDGDEVEVDGGTGTIVRLVARRAAA